MPGRQRLAGFGLLRWTPVLPQLEYRATSRTMFRFTAATEGLNCLGLREKLQEYAND